MVLLLAMYVKFVEEQIADGVRVPVRLAVGFTLNVTVKTVLLAQPLVETV